MVRPEVKVGLLTVMALVILSIMVFYINEIKVGQQHHQILVEFNRVVGIKEGAKVKLSGVDVGKVTRADLGDRSIFLHLEVPEGLELPLESRFVVGTMGLMGEAYIGIERSPEVTVALALDDADAVVPGADYQVRDTASGERFEAEATGRVDSAGSIVDFLFSSDAYPLPGDPIQVAEVSAGIVQPPVRRFVAVLPSSDPAVFKQLKTIYKKGVPLSIRFGNEADGSPWKMQLERLPRKRISSSGIMGYPLWKKELILLVLRGRYRGHIRGVDATVDMTAPDLSQPLTADYEGELYRGDNYFTANEFITEGGMLLRDVREGLVPEGQELLAEARAAVKNVSSAVDGIKRLEDRLMETFEPTTIRDMVERSVERVDRIGDNLEKASENVVEATGGVGDFIESVKGDISIVRTRIEGLSGKIEELVGTVDGTIVENKDTIKDTLQDARQFTANLKGVSEDVRDDVKLMVEKFRASSERVERMLQKLEEEEQLPEKTGEILNNVRESSLQIKEATGRVNEFVHDEDIEDDLKLALKGMGDMSGKVDKVLGKFKQTRFDLDFLLGFDDEEQETFGDCNLRVYPLGGINYFLAGSSDIGTEDSLNLQYGMVVDRYTTRVGIIRSKIGVGLDVRLMKQVTGSVEVHDLVTTTVDTSVTCSVSEQTSVFVKMEDVTRNKPSSQRFNFGVVNSF